jgi:hypothetical protein
MTTPPGYDLAMEIACTLPCEPCRVSLPTLAQEFGLPTQSALRKLLANAGIDFATGRTGKDANSIFVPRKWWGATQRACVKYWQSVYGE